jgi:predicted GH43/DUF377 family glycosyl hydrolase
MHEESYRGSVIRVSQIGPRRRVVVFAGGLIMDDECVWIDGGADEAVAVAESKRRIDRRLNSN